MKKSYQKSFVVFLALLLSLPLLSRIIVAQEAVPVTILPLEQLIFHPIKTAPAKVVTLQNSLLSSELSALVEKLSVQVGDSVSAEQLLITLECDDYELSKQQLLAEKKALEADYQFAQYQFERSQKLIKTKSVSQEAHRRQSADLSRLSAKLQLLSAKILQAEKAISRCYIKAPFAGVIAQRFVDVGEKVAPGTSLLQLINVHDLEVEVQAPIMMIDDLDYTSLDFVYRQQRYPVSIRAVIPSIETRARHQRVRLSFSNKKALPDAFGVVEITLREFRIPANYLVTRENKVGIFLLQETAKQHDIARFYALKNALTGRASVIDIALDSRVIIEGRHALSDGQQVRVQSHSQKRLQTPQYQSQ